MSRTTGFKVPRRRYSVIPAVASAFLLLPITAADANPFIDALLAQREGNFELCAENADAARKLPGSNYAVHRLFVSCTVNAAEAQHQTGGGDDIYRQRLGDAVEALELLLRTPGAFHQPKAKEVLVMTITDLRKRIASAALHAPAH